MDYNYSMPNAIEHFINENNKNTYLEWLSSLRDSTAKIAVVRRVARLSSGNFGDCKPCREGVWELRIDVGAGYRVYYSTTGNKIVLLLCGGNKKTQDNDIDNAIKYLKIWKEGQ
jgi:putative addiction module killer protein